MASLYQHFKRFNAQYGTDKAAFSDQSETPRLKKLELKPLARIEFVFAQKCANEGIQKRLM